nr:type II toxin-antitoxin system RelE/ParE family toxin [Desulfobacter vibrioformis]
MNLKNHHLIESVENLEKGLSVTNLGSNLFKVRVNREGQGKSSGFRTIIA